MKTTPILGTLFLCSLPTLAQSIPNGTFDSDLSGWTLPSQPDTTTTWDALGNPVGSMRIESDWSPPDWDRIAASTIGCFDLPSGAYTLAADIFAATAAVDSPWCYFEISRYSVPACAATEPVRSASDLSAIGSWQHLEVGFDVFEAETSSWRFAVVLRRFPGQEPSRCYFDNVRLLGPPVQTVEVPTLNGTALFAYGSVLAAAALMALRRRVGRDR